MHDRKVLILKNEPREDAGIVEEMLRAGGISCTVIEHADTVTLPSPAAFDAVVVMGGPDSANDATPKMARELALVREVLRHDIPFLGICLGLQVLVKAAGGEVHRCPRKELGLTTPEGEPYRISLTPEGLRDPLLQGLPGTFRVFQLHGETVRLTSSMALLGEGKECTNQIVRVGQRAYGIQCHCELTQPMLERWLREDSDLLTLDAVAVRREFSAIHPDYVACGRTLVGNFLTLIPGWQ